MRIDEKLNDLSSIAKFEGISNFLETAKITVDVTFWGTRIVRIDGFEGAVSLEEITQKVILATNNESNINQLTNKIRLAGFKLTDKLGSFYHQSENIVKSKNFFTKYLTYFREYKRDVRQRTDAKLYLEVTSFFSHFNKVQFETYFDEDFERSTFPWGYDINYIYISRDQIENLVNKEENKPLKPLTVLIGGMIYKMKA